MELAVLDALEAGIWPRVTPSMCPTQIVNPSNAILSHRVCIHNDEISESTRQPLQVYVEFPDPWVQVGMKGESMGSMHNNRHSSQPSGCPPDEASLGSLGVNYIKAFGGDKSVESSNGYEVG